MGKASPLGQAREKEGSLDTGEKKAKFLPSPVHKGQRERRKDLPGRWTFLKIQDKKRQPSEIVSLIKKLAQRREGWAAAARMLDCLLGNGGGAGEGRRQIA